MQRETGGKDNSNTFSSTLDKLRGMMSRLFGGKGPSDEPSLTRQSENLSESSGTPPGDLQPVSKLKGLVIVELDSDDEGEVGRETEEEETDVNGSRINRDKAQADAWVNANPIVEHPDDQLSADHNKGKNISKDVAHRVREKKTEGTQSQTQGVSYRRVTYGGINGAYYTATTTRRTGSDGMVLEDSKQADITTGQATHRISRGIHDKGHSLSRKLGSDGKVDTMQTLHNLEEGELAGFEQTWKGNADKHLPGWNNGSDFHANPGTSNNWVTKWNPEFGDPFGGFRPSSNAQPEPMHGRPKKVVTINIE